MAAAVAAAMALASAAAAAVPNDEDIVIVGPSKSYKLTGKELLAAQTAFVKYRPHYAPQGELLFEVFPRKAGASLDGLNLRLTDGMTTVPLPLDGEHRFRLPALDGKDWRIVSGRRDFPLGIRAWVYSPSSHFGSWRFGDLQLQCRVAWAIAKQSASVVTSSLFDMVGACSSSKIAIYQDMSRAISSAEISEGNRRSALQIWETRLRLPTYLKTYGQEARIEVAFR